MSINKYCKLYPLKLQKKTINPLDKPMKIIESLSLTLKMHKDLIPDNKNKENMLHCRHFIWLLPKMHIVKATST